MKQYINTILAAGALLTLCACEKENPFIGNPEEGRLDCKSLSVDYINRENSVRASNGVNLGDFIVNFVNKDTDKIIRSFKYSEMPEVVALPVGSYTAEASFGTDPDAEWEAPYYLGNASFDIVANKITDIVDPITCKLSNIKVTINFNDNGFGNFGDDAQVEVSAGEQGSLTFKKGETKAGYFKYVEGSTTLTATFSGTVDGNYVEGESKAYDNVAAGNFYKISFSIHSADNSDPGDITGDITVDGSVTVVDQNEEVDPNDTDRNYEEDDMRPVEPDNSGTEEPGTEEPGNEDPVDPTPGDDDQNKAPKIEGLEGTLIDQVNDGNSITSCKFKATSFHPEGFTEFYVDIISPTLTPDDLEEMGLQSHLDLIHDGLNIHNVSLWSILGNDFFKFPIDLGGKTEATFDITKFLSMLEALDPAKHEFKLTVSDGNGTSVHSVIIEYK